MTVQNVMINKTTDGVGTAFTNGSTIAIFAVTFKGTLKGGFLDILVDLDGGTNYIVAGQLTRKEPAKLILLPAGAKCTAKLSGAVEGTDVTVKMAS